MTWIDGVVSALQRNDVRRVAYLPDSALSGLIERVESNEPFEAVSLAREEHGVGLLSGAYLGGERGVLLCQSSGLATTINALSSLSKPTLIPFLAVVSQRGDLGEFNDAQVPFGYAVGDVLNCIGIRNRRLDVPETVERDVDLAAKSAFSTGEPYVLLLDATLTGAKDEF
jgi:sulfopyruvate decarboxylase alpha subunit